MTPTRRFALAISLVALMTVVGAAGYIMIEHMSLLDAFYMSVITISTVGFQEVKPLSPAGRLFTIGLIVTGVGSAIYVFTVIGELVVEGRLREFLGKSAMSRKIQGLQEHVIVCGYGRFGRAVVEELTRNTVSMVVIESDPTKQGDLGTASALHVMGSALEDSVLEDAGIGSARAIIVATGSDADNVYITLSAREKNPKILIYARGDSDAGLRRLKLAGADQVVAAYQWAGTENRGEYPASVGRGFSATLSAGPRVRGRSGGNQDLARQPSGRQDNLGGGTGESSSSDSGDEAQRPTARDDSCSRYKNRSR